MTLLVSTHVEHYAPVNKKKAIFYQHIFEMMTSY